MTLATTLILALFTATPPSSGGGSSDAILLDFHAEWCGPCRQMRPAVDRMIRQGYPVKAVDIDRSPELARRYNVQAVPTFVVVDRDGRELDRTSGLQPAGALEQFYLDAKAKAEPQPRAVPRIDADEDDGRELDDDEQPPARPVRRTGRRTMPDIDQDRLRERDDDRHLDDAGDEDDDRTPRGDDRPARPFANPHPIRTVVRIKVQGPHSTGFGTGTIIYSTPEMSVVLTCAHIFKLEGRNPQVPPDQFPSQIILDLFDGELHPQRGGPPKANYVESFPGQAVDYDFGLDVGLIVFRPGKQLPASRVVPKHWQPRSEPLPMKMLTVGCSEGHDATAWHTRVLEPRMKGALHGMPKYEAIKCEFAPKQGRSGGGLFTTDGYIAGVCNFAEPQGNHGLYATPHSIYSILDRNRLSALYAPANYDPHTLVSNDRGPTRSRPKSEEIQVARSQSPDTDEPAAALRAEETGDVMLPHYSLLGIKEPPGTDGDTATPRRSARRVAWHTKRPAAATPAPATTTTTTKAPAESRIETSGTEPSTHPRWRPVHAAGQD